MTRVSLLAIDDENELNSLETTLKFEMSDSNYVIKKYKVVHLLIKILYFNY